MFYEWLIKNDDVFNHHWHYLAFKPRTRTFGHKAQISKTIDNTCSFWLCTYSVTEFRFSMLKTLCRIPKMTIAASFCTYSVTKVRFRIIYREYFYSRISVYIVHLVLLIIYCNIVSLCIHKEVLHYSGISLENWHSRCFLLSASFAIK